MQLFIFVVFIVFLPNDILAFVLPSSIQPCSKWNSDALTIAGNGMQGDLSSQLSKPQQIAVDSSDKLYIYDTGNARIQIVEHGSVYTWPYLTEQLTGNCLFLDNQGTLFIENGNPKSITRWTGGSVSSDWGKCRPSGCLNMFVDSTTDDIYVTEYVNHRVIKCTLDGNQRVVAGITNEFGSSANKLTYPRGIFIDEETHDLFVADSDNDRIQKLPQHGKEGITVHNISGPKTLIKDKHNIFYVADKKNRILRLKPDKTQAETIAGSPVGMYGSSRSHLNNPTSFVFDSQGNLLVSDTGNHRIQKYLIDNTNCPLVSTKASPSQVVSTKHHQSLPTSTATLSEQTINNLLVEHMNNMRLELLAIHRQLERQQNQCKAESKDASDEFAQPNVRWCPWKSYTCVRQLERRGQGTISITQLRPIPFELILSDSSLLNASHHVLKLTVNSDRVTLSTSVRVLNETTNPKDTLHLTESGSHTYWLSVHSFDLSIKYGQGEVRDVLTILKWQLNETDRYDLAQLQYFHLILNKTTDLESITDFRDKINIFIGVQPVARDPPLLIVPRPPTGDVSHLTKSKYLLPLRLPLPNQQLYQDVTDWQLNDATFPDFIAAIERSVEEEDGWCYQTLKSKATVFGQSDSKATYLRITMGYHQGRSPGVPYVLEIWPPYHYSPIHKHSDSYGIIRVLYGKLSVKLYASLNIHHQDPFVETLLEPGNVTWLSPGLNQIHKVVNPTDKVSITIQAYQYGETDRDHYEYFDYIKNNGKDIGSFFPKRDEDFTVFKRIIQKEWNQYRNG